MPLAAGTRLGPYEILAPLGAGGMGEVYRARDTRLGRDVALKILPEEVATDASRRARFETEARAVAALNHPNIVAIFDVGEGYIVSELVEGESLRGVKLGLRKTIDLAVQLANGLAAAHGAGIVHRDLKPENILLTRDGRVKILDFGLAKLQPSRKAAAATETMRLQTEPGMVMGTAGYMSPEQVRGNDVDHRSDIFSFGVILYELFTGQRAFQGDTSVETMTAILKQDPPEMPETVPMPVRQIVARCLEKEPLNRFLSAGDLAFALSQSAGAPPSSGSKIIAQRLNWRWPVIAALAAVVGLAAGALIFRPSPPPVWMGVSLGGPEIAMAPRISPDGHTVAFTTMVDQLTQLAIMKPEAGDWAVLTHARDQGSIFVISWAFDGNRIYFDRQTETPRGIYSIPVLGGEPTLLLENAGAPEALPDGSLLISRLNAKHEMVVFRFWPESGKLQEFGIRVDSDNPQVRAFPGGLAAAVWGVPAAPANVTTPRLFRLDLSTGRLTDLRSELGLGGFDPAIAVSRDGRSIAVSSIAPARMVTLSADGHSSPRTLFSLPLPTINADVGPDGAIYLDLQQRPVALLRFALTGGHAERITTFEEGSFASGSMPLLPDGRTIWYQSVAGRTRLVVLEKGKDPRPLINTSEATASPVTVVGGDRIAFLIGVPGKQDIGIASIATGRVVRRISTPGGNVGAICASPDGKTLYFNSAGRIWAQPTDGGQATAIHAGDAVSADPSGSFLILIAKEEGVARLLRVPLDGGPEREIKIDGALRPGAELGSNAIRDGKLLTVVVAPDSWYWQPAVIDLATGKLTRIQTDYPADYWFLNWTPDGQILATAGGLRSSIWRFAPEGKQ